MEEVFSDGDDDDNRCSLGREQIHDLFLNNNNTSLITRSRSPLTISSHLTNRNIMSTPNAAQLADENRYLNDELNRVETVLNLTRAEKDELSIRYNALSDRVSSSF